MYLKSLELSGFKSFAKRAELSFSSPITAIVGPNGSGKSNVAEAFRFVLGEQSMKSMRGKRGEDLIFNGTAKSARQNRASVRLTFDNQKQTLPVDFDEVTLERVVHRDSTNEYLLNKSPVRLKDIVELLASAHIGASGHHIISQGEADRILNANPKERKEMIADALGLKLFEYKRAEAMRKLERTLENVKSVESLRREITPHLKFLKRQVERVQKALEIKKELVVLYRQYLCDEDVYIKAKKRFLEIEMRSPAEELRHLDQSLKEAKQTIETATQNSRLSSDLMRVESHLKNERITKEEVMRELGRLEGEIAALERSREREAKRRSADETRTLSLRDIEILKRDVVLLVSEGEVATDIGKIKLLLAKIRDAIVSFFGRGGGVAESEGISKAEIEELAEKKRVFEKKLQETLKMESFHVNEYTVIKETIEKEKEGSLEAEKTILKIMARQNEINAHYSTLRSEEERRLLEETEFKRELEEARILAGREAVAYEALAYNDPRAAALLLPEARRGQSEKRKEIERRKIRLEEFGAAGGEEVLKEYEDVRSRDEFLERETGDLGRAGETLRAIITDLGEKIDLEFREGTKKINSEFEKFFRLMFGGGSASLSVIKIERHRRADVEAFDEEEIVDGGTEEEKMEEGIDIDVALPHKKIKGLMMLSGGERALTSIALLFAMSQVNPPPFIILDETDAALDEANSRKYGDMIENLSNYSQLILITHNRETMSRAGVLYGVTMGSDGVSKLLSIQFDEAVVVAK